jgi:hypothetical protein
MLRPFRTGATGIALVLLAASVAGCDRSAAFLAGEPWPPRPPELPVEARAAIEAGEAWEGIGAAVPSLRVVEARSSAEWAALWGFVGRQPPGSLPPGRTAVGIFMGTGSPAVRVSTLRAVPVGAEGGRGPVTLVTYGVLGGTVAAAGGGGGSPWAIRLLPGGAPPSVRTEEVAMPATATVTVVPGPEAAAALASGLAFEGDDARLEQGGIFLARDEASWARLWTAAGRTPPVALAPGASAVGVFAGTQPVGGNRVFTGSVVTDPDGTTVFRHAIVPPGIGTPAGGGRRPWAIRILPAAGGPIAAIDLRAEASQPAWTRQSVAALVQGPVVPRTVVVAPPPDIQARPR